MNRHIKKIFVIFSILLLITTYTVSAEDLVDIPEQDTAQKQEEIDNSADESLINDKTPILEKEIPTTEKEIPATEKEIEVSNDKETTISEIKNITFSELPNGTMEINWEANENATLYKIAGDTISEETIETKIFLSNLERDTEYAIKIEAYKDEELIAEGTIEFKTRKIIFNEEEYASLTSKSVSPANLNVNLREMAGEKHSGYSVTQGAATDGTYVYYMLTSSSNQKGRVLKTNLFSGATVKAGPVINTHHANGMTYDSKRNRLVTVGYGDWRHQLSFIDPDTLTITAQKNVNYNPNMDGYKYTPNGIAAIAYVEKYDVYVARERGDVVSGGNNDIMVFDAETLNLIGYIRTKVSAAYPSIYQSMDADDKYIYFLLSPGKQPNNIILVLDWNSENLLPVVNGEKEYIKEIWKCNNDKSGKPDAVITLNTPYEAEGLFHIKDANGKNQFYLSEYHGHWAYKTIIQKEAYKVKWKKVKQKVKWKKVKWKKVKQKVLVDGKWKTQKVWKYKWKYKYKKVWKYKTKYRNVQKTVTDYWMRDDYAYRIGNL